MKAPAKLKVGDRVVFIRDDEYSQSLDAWCREIRFKTLTVSEVDFHIISIMENSYSYREEWLISEALYYSPLYQALK